MWKFLLLLIGIAAVVLGLAYADYQGYLQQPLHISEQQKSFSIEHGWSAKRVSRELLKSGIIDKPHWFDLHARLSNKASAIKSGEFELADTLTVPQLLNVFVEGQTVQYSHTVIEGLTFKQLRGRLAKAAHLEQSMAEQSGDQIMLALGLEGVHPEGQFFADTYSYSKNSTDIDYLRRANQTLKKILAEEWQQRQADLPLQSSYEALILASIVEKETAVAAERPVIAGVFLARLNKRMRLQTDPTVIYGMGDSYDGNIRRSDLTTDTPYNTYTRSGLPPTPIAMVGRDAIHAVLHPTATNSLYFVARGDGTHQFSATIEEHNAAVQQYQLRRRRP